MSSLGSILSVARSAMKAQQIAMQTTSQNIANANVAGYSAQRVELSGADAESWSFGQLGTGVSVQNITRGRDILLDGQFRQYSGLSSGSQTTSDVLSRVETIFGEPSDTGLNSAMDKFWNSFSDLANDPSSASARTAVRGRGQELATMFNNLAARLDEVDETSRNAISQDTNRANVLLDKVGKLNVSIVADEANGTSANDLRDERDRALDELSALTGAKAVERTDGSVAIYSSGHVLVDRDAVHHLVTSGATTVTVRTDSDTNAIPAFGGSIGANMDAVNKKIAAVHANLDMLAGSIVREVNAIQTTGTAFSGNPPVARAGDNFFTQNGAAGTGDVAQTAAGMSLDVSLSDLTNIVASGPGATGPGDNAVATRLAGLRDTQVTLYDASGAAAATTSLHTFFQKFTTDLGLSSSEAADYASAQKIVTTQAASRRESVSGVATDEELVSLIKQQQAYAAAARVISVVDEMSKTLIGIAN